MVLIFLVVCTVLMIFIDAGSINFVGRRKMDRSLLAISFNNCYWGLLWRKII